MTIGNLQEQEADARVDSAIVAIHENNKTRDQVTGPRHQEATDRVFDHRYTNNNRNNPEEIRVLVHRDRRQRAASGQCHGGHLQEQQQESTASTRPSTTKPAVSFPTVWVKAAAAANQQPTGIPGVGDNSCKPTPTARGLCTQFISVGRSGESHLHTTSYY
jgi:hypothetical protein